MRRTRIKRRKNSPAASYYATIRKDRDAWRDEQKQVCMLCGLRRDWLDLQIHEIERKSSSPRGWGVRCNYLLVCQRCHFGVLDVMPHAEQLAHKFVRDRENFDLSAWLSIKPRPETYVTMEEIMEFVARLG